MAFARERGSGELVLEPSIGQGSSWLEKGAGGGRVLMQETHPSAPRLCPPFQRRPQSPEEPPRHIRRPRGAQPQGRAI